MDSDEVDIPKFHQHLQYLIGDTTSANCFSGGTGEFFSPDLGEYRGLVKTAAEEVRGKLPILAGVRYGTKMAIEFAKTAEEAGANSLPVLPPYLAQSEQEGLYHHCRSIAESTRLGIILSQRDNAILTTTTVSRLAVIPNIIGLKDGHGDMERLIRLRLALAERLIPMNGLPTAEMSASAFRGIGVTSCSSAAFNFVPGMAQAFDNGFVQDDEKQVHRLMEGFYRPFADLRHRKKGYAVSLLKAG
jgi:5-dehydro-4-deoxyglucarate dehydratase